MHLKDYYKLLEVTPVASEQEIKTAFRRLALKYHPDKNEGNAFATVHFREIQEAYEILSNKLQREEYNYKRWYSRSLGKSFQPAFNTPSIILSECRRLAGYVAGTNIFQVDFDGLSYHIRQLLSDGNIAILQQYNQRPLNQQVVQYIMDASKSLPFVYISPIKDLLLRIAENDNSMTRNILLFSKQREQADSWNKYRFLAVTFATLVLCWIIYRLSK
jgi:molecular chaperone DnaJ